MNEEHEKFHQELVALIDLIADLKRRYPQMTKEYLNDQGDFLFAAKAIAEKNVKEWAVAQEIQLKREELTLRRSKLDLEWKEYKDKTGAADSEQKLQGTRGEQVKQILGISHI